MDTQRVVNHEVHRSPGRGAEACSKREASACYPVIQGFSVEDLLDRKPLVLPAYGLKRQGGPDISTEAPSSLLSSPLGQTNL